MNNNSHRSPIALIAIAALFSSLWVPSADAGPSSETIANFQLAPCPASPNCVSSQALDPARRVLTLAIDGNLAAQHQRLLAMLKTLPRTEIKEQSRHYIWVTVTTRIMRYVDDVEFLLVEGRPIEVRSASRVGYSDLGTNRRRVEKIRRALNDRQGPPSQKLKTPRQ